ncbi:MAG: ADP-glyceromanno-heptose 6-epimerase [Bdellovibrionota bacterium]
MRASQDLKPSILVTGAAGFIGARFVESCNHKNIPLISVDELDFFKNREEHRGLDFGRMVDRDDLFHWLQANDPHLSSIVHLGACSNTMETDEHFLNRVNVEYSQKLWNYCAQKQIPLVYASSAATYGDGDAGYEDDESRFGDLKPLNLYGKSKLLFDRWVLDQEKNRMQPPVWRGFKFFNVYGMGEKHKGPMASVVFKAFEQIRKTGRVELFKSHKNGIADGEQKRDFVYVGDVIEILHFALEHPIKRGVFNLGSGRARSFLDLTRAVFKAMNRPENVTFIETPAQIRDKYQYFTEAPMVRLLSEGYTGKMTPLEDGVLETVKKLLVIRPKI